MNLVRIINATRELGRSQGYVPLNLRDDFVVTDDGKNQLHAMTAAFEVTPEELMLIAHGATVYVSIYGSMQPIGSTVMQHLQAGSFWPPILLSVGPLPVEETDDTTLLPK